MIDAVPGPGAEPRARRRRRRGQRASGYTRLIGKDGTPIGNPGSGAPTLGGNWGTVPALNPFHLVAGHAPQAPDEVVIDKQSATARPPGGG